MSDKEYAEHLVDNYYDYNISENQMKAIIQQAMQAKAEAILREVEPSLKMFAEKCLSKKDAEYYMIGIKQAVLNAEVTE